MKKKLQVSSIKSFGFFIFDFERKKYFLKKNFRKESKKYENEKENSNKKKFFFLEGWGVFGRSRNDGEESCEGLGRGDA